MTASEGACDDDRPEPLPGFVDGALPDRFCDLVLTGGVTSSIAYPGAVFTLGTVFRFNGIGGSSSGGGTAALAAAAEYRRRRGSPAGFTQMVQGTAEVADTYQGRTGLQWLFQPDPGQERLFEVLVKTVSARRRAAATLLLALLRSYARWWLLPGLAVVGALAAWKPWLSFSTGLAWLGVLLLALVVAAGVAGLRLWLDLRRLAAADHGLCSGLARQPGAPREPITPWLHGLIQHVAGRAPGDAPLTFDDLHRAPGGPPGGAPSIDLRMFAADVTRGLPVQFPLRDDAIASGAQAPPVHPAPDDDAFYFLEDEMRALFPEKVVDHLVRHARRVANGACAVAGGRPSSDFHRLPGRHLPVIVAARITVSFPLLFRAVPLWAVSQPPAPAGQAAPGPQLRRCLLSDGGLVSAFPMHLFDSLLPAWPTFGIALHPLSETDAAAVDPCEVGRVHVPQQADDRGPERWDTPSHPPRGVNDLFGFAGAMLSTLMSWNDNAVRRMAGVRDRVAHVSLKPGIGGLNLLMTGQDIRRLARLGTQAGRALLERFVFDLDATGRGRGWSEHRWTRFVLLAQSLARAGEGLAGSAQRAPHGEPLAQQIARAQTTPPLRGRPGRAARRQTLLANEAAALHGLLQALQAAEPALRHAGRAVPDAPGPAPELRQRPPP